MPSSLAALLRELELDRPEVVTTAYLDALGDRVGQPLNPAEVARRLRSLGWLIPLRVRGAWEFAPADRGGAFGGGDRFIEVRALRAVRPEILVTVGYESAIFLHWGGLRRPDRGTLVLPEGTRNVRSLDRFRRIALTLPDGTDTDLKGLRVQTPDGLLAAIAIRPDAVDDWNRVQAALPLLAGAVDPLTQLRLLQRRGPSSWARAAYLLARGGNGEATRVLLRERPAGSGPFYLGARHLRGRYDPLTQVMDTVLPALGPTHQR